MKKEYHDLVKNWQLIMMVSDEEGGNFRQSDLGLVDFCTKLALYLLADDFS